MADAALENALARRDNIKERINGLADDLRRLLELRSELADDLARVQEFIGTWYEMAGIRPPPPSEQKEAVKPEVAKTPPRPVNPNRRDVALKCVEYIREAAKPLSRGELFERLTTDGIIIHGKDPQMVLSTMLWRGKEYVRRLRGGGYWPALDPLPHGHALDIEDLMR